MKSVILIVFLLFCIDLNSLRAQEMVLSSGTPAGVNMDEFALNAGVDLFREAVDADSLRSAVLLVARHGQVILHKALGWKNREEALSIQKNALFRMASNTKPVVATAINLLADDGKLDVQDYVYQHLDSFDNTRSREITIHHLLTHTSGFRIEPIFNQPLIQPSPEHPEAPSLQLEVDRFGETGATEQVGTSFSYSNAGYNTLGALIEVITGQPLERFIKDRIYLPLGMVDTYHHEVEDMLDGKLNRMSVVYNYRDGHWTVGWKPGDPPQYPFIRASGGMISTAWDYAIFCQMFLNGGVYNGQQILKKETVERMISPQTASLYSREEQELQNSFYGYGWSIDRKGVFSHSGSDGTAAWIDPAFDLIVLVFTQSPGRLDLSERFFHQVQASIIQ